eukprot:CAMPEP_0194048942 /NCGR_PEP_ID=MMETSP0009_2-20130614/29068_1 /TAXON_ID=210454 /ORGANISM="Grammatophora oceanica, Strain CCMP 410" /LENGTH=682 /DNA_ID=CAMNT_0038694977 /DNA_START=71 /DNA_END=2122 /DNA_ORIENTATION=+
MVDEAGLAPVVNLTEERKEKKKKSKSEKKSKKSKSGSSSKSSNRSPEVAEEVEEMSPQAVTELPTKMISAHMNGNGSEGGRGIEAMPNGERPSGFVLPEVVEEESDDDATYMSSMSRMSAAFVQFAPSIPFVEDGGVESAGFQRIEAENKPALVECVAADNIYVDPEPTRSPRPVPEQSPDNQGRQSRGRRKSRGGGIIGGLTALSQGSSSQDKDDMTIMTAPTPGSGGGRRRRSRSLTGRDMRRAARDAASTDSQSISSAKMYSSQSVTLGVGRSGASESSAPVPTNISTRGPTRSQSLFQPRTSPDAGSGSGLSHEQMLNDPRLQQMLADPRLQQMLADRNPEPEEEPQHQHQQPQAPTQPPPASYAVPPAPRSRSHSISSNTSDLASDYGDQQSLQSTRSGDGGSVGAGGRRKFKLNVMANHVQSDYREDDSNSTNSDRLSEGSPQKVLPDKALTNGKPGKPAKEKKGKRRFKMSKLLGNHVQADYDLEEELGITVSDPVNSLHSILEQEDEIAEAVLAARQIPVGRPIKNPEAELAALNAIEDRSEGRRLPTRLGLERKGSEKQQGGDWGLGNESGGKEKRGIGRMFRKKNKNGDVAVDSSEHGSDMSFSSGQRRMSNNDNSMPSPSSDHGQWEHPSGMMAPPPGKSPKQTRDARARVMEDNASNSFRRRRRSTGPAE